MSNPGPTSPEGERPVAPAPRWTRRPTSRTPWAAALLAGVAALGIGIPAEAQENPIHAEGFLEPSEEIAQGVLAPRYERVTLTSLAPDGEHFLHTESGGPTPMERLARPHYNLGGLYVDKNANRSRRLTTRGSERVALVDWRDGSETDVEIPSGARASATSWSPDGERMAFLAHYEEESHVYVADLANGASERISPRPVLATRVTGLQWSGDGRYVYTVLVPEGRGAEPEAPDSPVTPRIRVTSEHENRLRTFPTLFKDPHDKELFEYHTTGQVARIDVENGEVEPIGEPDLVESINVSPSGEHLRVRLTDRPFSYIVTASRFPRREVIWDLEGEELTVLDERAVRDGADRDDDDENDEPDKRNLQWRPDGEGLSFLQMEPEPEEEDDDENEERLDRVMQWHPPFGDDDVEVVYESENEMSSVRYADGADVLFITERDGSEEHLYAVFLDDPDERHTIYRYDRDEWRDTPGSLRSTRNDLGVSVVRMSSDREHVYLRGTRYFEDPLEDAPRPFLDRVEIRAGEEAEPERLFESAEDAYERVDQMLDDDGTEVIIRREAPTQIPNSYHLNLETGEERQITDNVDHTPDITNAQRDAFMVTRVDGFTFRVRVAVPEDWDGERLPAIFWHYPREYSDQESYDDSTGRFNKNSFAGSPGGRSADHFLRAGYAVVRPDFPIVGPLSRVNDSFLPDLRANWSAIIDAVDERGYIDRRRVALGGHSYGGFGTIHALVQTPFFRAGIAGAPNSNRILTPMGFQRERRLLWEDRETYMEMSPIMWAERMEGALLVYHGDDDQNVGTWPANSWRLFHALNGLGKTAAFYFYPYEGHGPGSHETLLDIWARWIEWMDHYVKDADPTEPPEPVAQDEEQDAQDH